METHENTVWYQMLRHQLCKTHRRIMEEKNISHLKRLEGLNTNFGSFMGAFERRSGIPGGHRWNELPSCRPSNG